MDYFDDDYLRLVRTVAGRAFIENAAIVELRRNLADPFQRLGFPVSEAFRAQVEHHARQGDALQSILDTFKHFGPQLGVIAEANREAYGLAAELVRPISIPPGLERLHTIAGQFASGAALDMNVMAGVQADSIRALLRPVPEWVLEYETELGTRVAELVGELQEADSDEQAESIVSRIIAVLAESLAQPLGEIVRERLWEIIHILLVIAVCSYEQHHANLVRKEDHREHQRLYAAIRRLEDTQRQHAASGPERLYVRRAVNLRVRPTTRSAIITTLPPNQELVLHARRGKWVYVEFFEHSEGITRTGWAFKKYLHPVVPKGRR